MDGNMGSSIFQAGSVNIDSAAQNLEEEEELAEMKRRQEEIQSLLTKAMDDFNYDDQSTVNSSINESGNEYAQQYKEAGLENQLEVMYNIRVKEVQSLQEKLQGKEQQLADMKAEMLQSRMLTEAENDKLRTSLKNSQELLVDKCNQIEIMNNENRRVLLDIEGLKQVLGKLEVEKAAVSFNNQELREQIAVFENGRGANPLSDAVLQENHHAELTKLQHTLENAFSKNRRLENENVALLEKLNSAMSEKEDLVANKTEIINKLMQNVDQAQEHNRELLGSVTRLTAENDRFKTQIHELESNVQVMKGFTDKTEIIKILQKELEKSKHLNGKQTVEFEKLHNEYTELLKKFKAGEIHIKLLEDEIATMERTPITDCQEVQTSRMMESFSVSNKLRDELSVFKQELHQKEQEASAQLEKIKILEEDVINLNKKLELSAKRDSLTSALQEKATRLEEFIINNQKPQCETRSTNTEAPETPAPAPQTRGPESSEEILKIYQTQFETDLIEKEIELRKLLHNEFTKKYDELKQQYSKTCEKCAILSKDLELKQRQVMELQDMQAKMFETVKQNTNTCEMCQDMSVGLMRNVEIIQQQESELERYRINQEKDKAVILQILNEWKEKFEQVEQEKLILKQRLDEALKAFTAAQAEVALMRKSEEELVEMVKARARNEVEMWTRQTVQVVRTHNYKIKASKEKIDGVSRKGDERIKEIEKKYSIAATTLKHKNIKDKLKL